MAQPRSSLPRPNLELRENTACLFKEGFQVLPTGKELGQWLEKEGFKDQPEALTQVLDGFRNLIIDPWVKRMCMTFGANTQLGVFLKAMNQEGDPRGAGSGLAWSTRCG